MLSLAGSIYQGIAQLRNRLYDAGILESFDLGARTISIGNITAGGTGKTPLTAYVADVLADRGDRVCILTRGYGRKDPKRRVLVSDGAKIFAAPTEAGDEPFELAQKLIGKAIVIADADRVAAAEWAKRKFGVTAFILDDGFQHRKVKRDVDIVCIDATDPFGGGKMLPAGRLREPVSNLSRVDVLVITRANLLEDISDLRSEILEIASEAALFEATSQIVRVVELHEFHAKTRRTLSVGKDAVISSLADQTTSAFAFCGIGNPANFFKQLKNEKFSITATNAFPDHYIYTQADADHLAKHARGSGASILLTTAKDAVKLSGLGFEIPCFVVEIKLALDNTEEFASML